MRIDRLTMRNFNGFDACEIGFDPRFNLLVGDNGKGKTTVLDALSILFDSWVLGIKGNEKGGGIDPDQVRLKDYSHAGRFEPQLPVLIRANGEIMGKDHSWSRERISLEGRTRYVDAKKVTQEARKAGQAVANNEEILLPLVASYGTERRWYESSHRAKRNSGEMREGYPSRLDGYLDCNLFEIQETAVLAWIRAQYFDKTAALTILEEAVAACIDGAASLSYSETYKSVSIEINSKHELYRNLSDGQKVMLSLIGDMVRRAWYLNSHLGKDVLKTTPGIVLIDELDLHLHPKWQRRIIHDLKRTFPLIQFITTTHSPQLIGEARTHEVRILEGGKVYSPPHSFGLDSSRVLCEIQGAAERDPGIGARIHQIAKEIDAEHFDEARLLIRQLEEALGKDDAEIVRARSLIDFMEAPI